MSELFNTLLLELGEKIAQNSEVITKNQSEIDSLALDSKNIDAVSRISELIDINNRLKVESYEYVLLQLKLRSYLRNINEFVLLPIEEKSGVWIDENTERFILAGGNVEFKNSTFTKIISFLQKKSIGTVFDFKLINNMPSNMIEQYVQDEKYEMCSILINTFSSKN
ncbi:MAG: hypothetical protein AB7S48_15295 [Bacteroidales bacterium]